MHFESSSRECRPDDGMVVCALIASISQPRLMADDLRCVHTVIALGSIGADESATTEHPNYKGSTWTQRQRRWRGKIDWFLHAFLRSLSWRNGSKTRTRTSNSKRHCSPHLTGGANPIGWNDEEEETRWQQSASWLLSDRFRSNGRWSMRRRGSKVR